MLSWSLLEAMSAGALIVASGTEPVREVVEDGVTGRLVDFFDVAGLAETVAGTLAERASLGPMRRAARDFAVANYDLATVCLPRQMKLFDDLVAGRTSAPAEGVEGRVA